MVARFVHSTSVRPTYFFIVRLRTTTTSLCQDCHVEMRVDLFKKTLYSFVFTASDSAAFLLPLCPVDTLLSISLPLYYLF